MNSIYNFENDIFISYAHIDNLPLAEGLKGWVEAFHERLATRLAQLLGDEVRIWRDLKLQGNDVFADALTSRIENAAVLVSVLSPRYIKSEWCMRELNEFCKQASAKGSLRIGDKLRVFKVVKTYIPFAEHPEQLRGTLGYEFYEYDQARDRAKEFNSEVTPARDIRYWEKLDDLAYDIKQLVEYIRRSTLQPVTPAIEPSGKTIYLAETTSDLREDRNKIKRELQQRGHVVLPDKELPLVGSEFKAMVTESLERSHLSIHPVGERYGIIPEEETRSVVQLQTELAGQLQGELQRIIWMPDGLQPRDEAQQKFIDYLRLGLESHKSTEVLETKLEDLKTVILEKLTAKPKPEAATAAVSATSARASLYLICDRQDFSETAELENYLFDQGLDVTLPATEGDEAQIIQDHKDSLLVCDAALIYYGRAGELWLRMKQRELQKIAGYGRTQPMLARGIYISGPPTEAKERVRDHEAVIIKNYGGFSPEDLQPFVARLQKAKGA
jgi:TIR domain